MSTPSELARTADRLLALARPLTDEGLGASRAVEARTLLESAIVCAHAAGESALPTLAEAERTSARLAYADGDVARAETAFRRAGEAYTQLGDVVAAGRAEASAAFAAYDRGDVSGSLVTLDRIEPRLTSVDAADARLGALTALIVGYRGNLARQAGALDDARALYARALDLARAARAPVPLATFTMDRGATELVAGRPREALTWLGRAARYVERVPAGLEARSLLAPLVAHYAALAHLALGHHVDVEVGGPEPLFAIRTWLSDAMRSGPGAPVIDARLERRLVALEQRPSHLEHARLGTRILRTSTRIADREHRVLVACDGSSIVNGVAYADLSEREPLRRMLERLASAHHTEASGVVTLGELVTAAWPGERMQERAARNRAHVALSTLRSLGLGDALTRSAGGYRLDPRRCRVGSSCTE